MEDGWKGEMKYRKSFIHDQVSVGEGAPGNRQFLYLACQLDTLQTKHGLAYIAFILKTDI